LHVGVVIATFMIAAILHACLHMLVRAKTVEEARPFAAIVHRLEPILPILAIFILGFGIGLVQMSQHGDNGNFHFGDGWIITALTALVVIEALAGALLAPHSKKLVAAIEEAPNGPMSTELRTQSRDPYIWYLAHTATVGFLGVVFVMTNKPSGAVSALVVIIGVLLGWALSYWQLSIAARLHSATGTPAPVTAPPS
jgi:hypothetical protein